MMRSTSDTWKTLLQFGNYGNDAINKWDFSLVLNVCREFLWRHFSCQTVPCSCQAHRLLSRKSLCSNSVHSVYAMQNFNACMCRYASAAGGNPLIYRVPHSKILDTPTVKFRFTHFYAANIRLRFMGSSADGANSLAVWYSSGKQ